MVVLLLCCTVASPSPWAIFKATSSGRWALAYSRITTIATRLRVDAGGDVEEKAPTYAPSDPTCCPSSRTYPRALQRHGVQDAARPGLTAPRPSADAGTR